MTLATVDASGQPSARIVLIKGYDERGFTFSPTTNRARARTCWPSRACLLFFWQPLERQVRIEGVVEKVAAENPTPITSRPAGSRIGAPGPRARASPSPAKNWRPASRNSAPAGDQPPRRRTGAATA